MNSEPLSLAAEAWMPAESTGSGKVSANWRADVRTTSARKQASRRASVSLSCGLRDRRHVRNFSNSSIVALLSVSPSLHLRRVEFVQLLIPKEEGILIFMGGPHMMELGKKVPQPKTGKPSGLHIMSAMATGSFPSDFSWRSTPTMRPLRRNMD